MKRRHSPEEEALLRRWERLLSLRFFSPKRISCKRRPMDCGRVRCGICHGHKRFGHKATRQELLADLTYREGLDALSPDEALIDDRIAATSLKILEELNELSGWWRWYRDVRGPAPQAPGPDPGSAEAAGPGGAGPS